jgi:hypothetical protein
VGARILLGLETMLNLHLARSLVDSFDSFKSCMELSEYVTGSVAAGVPLIRRRSVILITSQTVVLVATSMVL